MPRLGKWNETVKCFGATTDRHSIGICGCVWWRGKHKADYTWPFSTGSISFSEVECCERKTGVLGKQWLGSGIVENATERALWMQFTIEFSGEDGLVLADVYTTEITLLSGQRGKVIFGLSHFDYDDIESFKRVSVKTEY